MAILGIFHIWTVRLDKCAHESWCHWYIVLYTSYNSISQMLNMWYHLIPQLWLFTTILLLLVPHIFRNRSIWTFGLVLYPINGIQFRLVLISASSSVRPFSPTQVLSELIQPPGPHCSSPSWVTPASGTICRLLVDRQKGGSLQFLIACSGKDSL